MVSTTAKMDFGELLSHFIKTKRSSNAHLEGQTRKFAYWFAAHGYPEKKWYVSKRDIANWRTGIVTKPQQWQKLVMLAQGLELGEQETNQLLVAAHHASLDQLRNNVHGPEDQRLLSYWQQSPNQLPDDLEYFVGREEELAQVERILLSGKGPRWCLVHGMAGVGKTMFAVHAGHLLRDKFPDGILWAKLDKSDPLATLDRFATAYGYDVTRYADLQSRSDAVRELLASKQALILLDNAQEDEQVRPLLPSGKPAVLVTTRHTLGVEDRMMRVELHPFESSGEYALQLFAHFLGKRAVQKHRALLFEISDLVGHLPFAIAISAGRLKWAQGEKLDHAIETFLTQLQNDRHRLGELTHGSDSIRATFEASYAALGEEQKKLFVNLSVFNGDDFDDEAVGFVAEIDVAQARIGIESLLERSLVQRSRVGRYRLHRLLKDYAQEKLQEDNAIGRMVQFYANKARTLITDDFRALTWEHSNILAALKAAQNLGRHELFTQTIIACNPYLLGQGLYRLAEENLERAGRSSFVFHNPKVRLEVTFQRAILEQRRRNFTFVITLLEECLAMAETLKETRVYCRSLNRLGAASLSLGKLERAQVLLQKALDAVNEFQHFDLLPIIHSNFGMLNYALGRLEIADSFFSRGWKLTTQYSGKGIREAQLNLLLGKGRVAFVRGEWDEAEKYWSQGAELCATAANRGYLLWFLGSLGELSLRQEKWTRAERFFDELQTLTQQMDPEIPSRAIALCGLAEVAWHQNDAKRATELLNQALVLAQKRGRSRDVGRVLMVIGQFEIYQIHWIQAQINLEQALQFSMDPGSERQRAEILFTLAQVQMAQKKTEAARKLALESQMLFEEKGHYRAPQIKEWLQDMGA